MPVEAAGRRWRPARATVPDVKARYGFAGPVLTGPALDLLEKL